MATPGRSVTIKGNTASITFEDKDDWGSGFVGAVSFTNLKTTGLGNWTIAFDLSQTITSIWNAEIVSHVGTHYVIRNAAYNGTVAAGGTVSFGFQADNGNPTLPSSFVLNGVTISGATTPPPPPPPPELPTLAIGDVTVTESTTANIRATFKVTLSEASDKVVVARWTTVAGTAVAGEDFIARSGSVRFDPGQTQRNIVIDTRPGDDPRVTFKVELSAPRNATIEDGSATGTIINPSAVEPPPVITVADITVNEPPVTDTPDGPTSLLPNGFLHTEGNQIVDASGNPVKIAAVNWFGMETTNYAPHGLWTENYKVLIDKMVQVGFNTIRLPFSDQLFAVGSTPNGIDFGKNPDLAGLTGQQIMDKIIGYAGEKGMKVFLDHHRSSAGNGPNGNGLWYDSNYSEAKMIQNWVQLTQRYAGNSTVIGMDLANEPHGPATWGDGGANDWAAAATRIGNAILAANPNLLIMVEGIESYKGQSTWWGGNLMGVKDHPIELNIDNRVVYSPHDYPSTVYAQRWFSDPTYPNNLPAVWDQYWGYIYKTDIAPVLLGEFGTNLETASDRAWLTKLVQYLDESSANGGLSVSPDELGPSWAYWSWNPNSGDTGGILENDWRTIDTEKVDAIDPIMFHDDNDDPGGPSDPVPNGTASFVVKLSEASDVAVTVNYHTVDGTAKAGDDYAPISGMLTFLPGETTKILSTQLFATPEDTGQMQFLLALDSPTNGTLGTVSAKAILVHDSVVTTPGDDTPTDPDPVSGDPVSLTLNDNWGSGYVGAVAVKNTTTGAVGGWTVEIDTNDLITNVWNATILGQTTNGYLIGNASWNGSLGSGASTSFGFQASNTDPTDTLSAQLVRFA